MLKSVAKIADLRRNKKSLFLVHECLLSFHFLQRFDSHLFFSIMGKWDG
jgi:hypothetical protein